MAPTLRRLRPSPRKQSDRPSRNASSRVQSYREDSSDTDSGSRLARALTFRPRSPKSVPQTVPHGSRFKTEPLNTARLPPKVTRSSSSRAKRSLFSKASPSKRRKVDGSQDESTIHTGPVPPWTTLPYHVLLEVLSLAAPFSNTDPTIDNNRPVKWLIATARLSRAFFEPAIAVLYHSPPLNTTTKLTHLVQLLERDPDGLMTSYANKVKELSINAGLSQVRHADLFRLLALTPQLKSLRIYDPTEYGQPKRRLPSSALNHLVSVLDASGCRLHHWEWNKRQVTNNVKSVHLHPSFNSLRSLRLFNLDFDDMPDEDTSLEGHSEECSLAKDFAAGLSELPDLKLLELQNCCLYGITFLLALPPDLHSLMITNCDKLSSANLERFLDSHGHHLKELYLSHNRDLNLSFTTTLKSSCPRLEIFQADFNFSSPTVFSYDVGPHFDALLNDSETPSWPTSLQVIQLERLRKWEVSTAERLFRSLIESSKQLLDLRTLIVTAILNVSWRERAGLRKQWGEDFEYVFLRNSEPPNPNHRSLRPERTAVREDSFNVAINTPRVAKPEPEAPKRHSKRIASKDGHDRNGSYAANSPSETTSQASDYEAKALLSDAFVQGMCDTVKIQIDNLRPADVLLTAENFQDEELSGDEDWNGEDMELDEEYAW